jgi:hypothetical protein
VGWRARLGVGVALSCALAGCAGTGHHVSLAGQAHSSQDALLRARTLLDRVYLPGAVRTETPISSLSGGGAHQVREQRWFTVLGQAEPIIAGLEAHPPSGLESWAPPYQSTATSAPLQTVSAGLRPIGQRDEAQTLEVLAIDLGHGRVRLEVEAAVGWVGDRPPLETIPAQVTDVQLAIQIANQPDESMNRDNTLTPEQVQGLTSMLNSLHLSANGIASSCFDPDLASAVLTLTFAGHHASYAMEVGGCNEVSVTVDGRPQPVLMDDRAVTHLVRAILGINI